MGTDGSQPPTTEDSGFRSGFIPKLTPSSPTGEVFTTPSPSSRWKSRDSPTGIPISATFSLLYHPIIPQFWCSQAWENTGNALRALLGISQSSQYPPKTETGRGTGARERLIHVGAGGCGVFPVLLPTGRGDSPLGQSRLSARFPGAASGFPPAAASFPAGAAAKHSLRIPPSGIKPHPSVKSVIPAVFPPRARLELTQGVYSESVTGSM